MKHETHYGIYGGQYVAETLLPTLHEVEAAYDEAMSDPEFHRELNDLLKDYVGRQSPLYRDARGGDGHGGGAFRDAVRRIHGCS